MKTLEITQATAPLAPLAAYARDVNSETVVVTRDGKPIAALVAITNADDETVGLSTHPQFIALIERSRSRHSLEGGVSRDEMRRRLGL